MYIAMFGLLWIITVTIIFISLFKVDFTITFYDYKKPIKYQPISNNNNCNDNFILDFTKSHDTDSMDYLSKYLRTGICQ